MNYTCICYTTRVLYGQSPNISKSPNTYYNITLDITNRSIINFDLALILSSLIFKPDVIS